MAYPPYEIFINYEQPYEIDEVGIYAAASTALSTGQAVTPCAMTVTLSNTERLHQLNLAYAGIDSPTDVLSFAAEDNPYDVEPDEPPYIGDVIIAVPIADKQAIQHNHSLLSELQTLTIHGTLHLLGFDHQTPDQQAEMWAYESAAKDSLRSDGWV
jgi:probable rRNA maturation factor